MERPSEGSGLIDIRHLWAKAEDTHTATRLEPVVVARPLSPAPPPARTPEARLKWVAIGTIAVAMTAVAGAVGVAMSRPAQPQPVPTPIAGPPPDIAADPSEPASAAPEYQADAPTSVVDPEREPEAELVDDEPGIAVADPRTPRRERDRRRPEHDAPEVRAEPTGPQTLAQLMRSAAERGEDPLAPTPGRIEREQPPRTLPDTPPRDAVRRVLGGLSNDVRRCGDGSHGVAQVRVTATGNGAIRSAVVSGDFAGTPVGSCVARTVRGARFPRFARDRFSVTFPYRI